MKKLLIGTTALVAAGTIATGAQAADRIKMGVGGYFLAFLVAGEQDKDAGLRSYDVQREAEIIFSGRTKLDNGITFGVQVQLEAETCGDQIDETFMFFQGAFGRVLVGSENSAAYLMSYKAPAPSHWAHGLNSPGFRHYNTVSSGGQTATFASTNHQLTSDSEKVTYFSPRFGGFQVGVSFTPDNTEETSAYGGFTANNTAGQQSDVIEVGANFVRKFGGVNVALSAGFGQGQIEVETATADDRTEFSVGASIGFAGFTVGAAYRNDDNGLKANNTDAHHFNVGARYARGAWGVGIMYQGIIHEAGVAGTEQTYDAVEFGGSYALGPGVLLNGGVQWHNLDDGVAGSVLGDNEAIIFFIGTALSF